MGNNTAALEKADSQWEQILKCRPEIWQTTRTSIISPICIHPNRVEKRKLNYLTRNIVYCLKTAKVLILDKEQSIFVNIFEFYFVTKSRFSRPKHHTKQLTIQ